MELLDKDGNVIKSQKSEFDGFVLLQKVPLGDYKAQVKPDQLKQLGYCPAGQQSVSLTEEEPFATLEDFILVSKEDGSTSLIGVLLSDKVHLDDAKFKWEILKDIFAETFEDVGAQYQIQTTAYKVNEPLYHLVAGPYESEEAITNTCKELFKYGQPCGQTVWKTCTF